MNIRYLLFDFDGTVIDNSEGIFNCIKYALEKMGLPCPDDAVLRSFIGPSLHERFIEEIENSPEKADRFVTLYRERYAPVGKFEVKLYPGIEQTLSKLRGEGFRLAVCSSKPLPFIKDIAKHLEIDGYFEFYSCTEFGDKGSDKTQLIGACVDHFKADKTEVLMIGDTVFDIAAAKKAGVNSLGVLYGFSAPGEIENSGATCIAETAADLYRAIKEL